MQTPLPLRVSEMMYHPRTIDPNDLFDDDDYEFIEVKNIGDETLSLEGIEFTRGIEFAFDDGSVHSLAPGEIVVVVKNLRAFSSRYDTAGIKIAGEFGGQLNNGGELVVLEDSFGQVIQSINYLDFWYPLTDGEGYSLVATQVSATDPYVYDASRWQVSDAIDGTPGIDQSSLRPGSVVISEVLAHTTSPDGGWIELHNASSRPVDVGGWFLSDTVDELRKYRIADGQVLPAGGYLLLSSREHFGNAANAGTLIAFSVDPGDGAVYLTSANAQGSLGGYREQAEMVATVADVTIGRLDKIDGTAEYVPLCAPTPGLPNDSPFVGPVVINEIMHSPLTGDEYIELLNISSQPVQLFDPYHPDKTWRFTEGVNYKFPEGVILPAGAYALVVKSDPDIFRERSGLSADTLVLGPYKGALRNEGEAVALNRATSSGPRDDTEYPLVDRILYDDIAPWPTLATGFGSSLERRDPSRYGNDAANWTASLGGGTAGRANVGVDDSAQPLPWQERFEVERLDQLVGWTLTSGGVGGWWLEDDPGVQGQTLVSNLSYCWQCEQQQLRNGAIVALELDADTHWSFEVDVHAEFDFYDGGLSVFVSPDRRRWYPVAEQVTPRQGNHAYAFDLSGALQEHGLSQEGTRYVQLVHSMPGTRLSLSNLRVFAGDVRGPWISRHDLISPELHTVSGIEVEFDEPIDVQTLTEHDVEVTAPDGKQIPVTRLTTDNRSVWRIEFPSQSLGGQYRLRIGPEVRDLDGNAMSRHSYAVDRNSPESQVYDAEFRIAASQPESFPYFMGFELADLTRLQGWEFSSGLATTWSITDQTSPAQGERHLSIRAGQGGRANSADIFLDLSPQADATDLSLDFQAKVGRREDVWGTWLTLYASQDGRDWRPLYGLAPTDEYQRYAMDLDQALIQVGIDWSRPIYLRLEQAGEVKVASGMFLDALRVSNLDVLGPVVVPNDSIPLLDPPVRSFQVTFDEPIDTASFTAEDIHLTGPTGEPIPVSSVTSADSLTFTVAFEEQVMPGKYSYTVGPDIEDRLGNPMNQNGNLVAGETSDGFSGSLEIPLRSTSTFPYSQSFEDTNLARLSGWAFSALGEGRWTIETDLMAPDGSRVLRAGQKQDGFSHQEAIVALDLSQQANVDTMSLVFWAKETAGTAPGSSRLFVSGDGRHWSWVADLRPSRQEYVQHTFNLKEILRLNGIALDDDVRVKIEHVSERARSSLMLDDLRVTPADLVGPRILGHSDLTFSDQTGRVTVTFDKPIDAASFTGDDAELRLTGAAIRATGVRAVDERTFEIEFPKPGMSGLYDLVIQPDIRGTNGVLMNQTADPYNGASDDAYAGIVFVPNTPQTLPYQQTFDSPDITDLAGWMFHTINEGGFRAGGEWRVTGDFDPLGDYHLQATQFADCWSQHDGILALDLREHASATDLVLEFYLQRTTSNINKSQGGQRNMAQLMIGDDIRRFVQVGDARTLLSDAAQSRFEDLNRDGILDLVPEFGQYALYRFDLDQLINEAGLAVDGVRYVNFHRLAFYSSDVTTFDKIRIYRAGQGQGPSVAETRLDADSARFDLGVVDQVTITFDRPVTGFDLSDLSLRRDHGTNRLPGGARLTQLDPVTWQLSGLEPVVNLPGKYRLSLDGPASGIRDEAGRPMEFSLLESWTDRRVAGDADLDGRFTSSDLVRVFQAGKYEDSAKGNATWAEGDWDGDGDFGTSDLVAAFQAGQYSLAAAAVDAALKG